MLKDSDTKEAFGHWGVAIINIMYRETDLQFELWENSEHSYSYQNRPSVMFTQRMPFHMNDAEKNMSHSSLIQILDRYAKELKTEIAEDCYFAMELDAAED